MKIIITGGGTGGHIFPALAVAQKLRARGHQIEWIGDRRGPEKKIAREHDFDFHGIFTGKLRRYFDWRNFSDFFKVIYGFAQARTFLGNARPDIIFSKGGFVSVPVAVAARTLGIPVVTHESDATPGFATKLIARWGHAQVCAGFESLVGFFPRGKVTVTGTPVGEHFFAADRVAARAVLRLSKDEKLITVFGGSQGATAINELIFDCYHDLLPQVKIIHQVGSVSWERALQAQKDLMEESQAQLTLAQTFPNEELAQILKASDVVISRAGATTLAELAALGACAILIPLPTLGSRGDQLDNAKYLEKADAAAVCRQEDLTAATLQKKISALLADDERRAAMAANLNDFAQPAATDKIVQVLEKYNTDAPA